MMNTQSVGGPLIDTKGDIDTEALTVRELSTFPPVESVSDSRFGE